MSRFSPFVLNALTEVITGGSGNDPAPPVGIYRSGSKIEQFFLDCGIIMRVGASSRVPATLECLRRIYADASDELALERVMLRVTDPRDYLDAPEKATAVIDRLNAALEADGFVLRIVAGKPQLIEKLTAGVTIEAIVTKAELLDFDTVQRDIARAMESAKTDPEDAVTAACSLVESVCRSILVEMRISLPPKKDIDGLIRAVQEPLGLLPGRTDLPKEIEDDIRQVLGGLTSIAKGIGALRTHAGDAHGRERGFRRIDARIARLAINVASSLATFLIETWERQRGRALSRQ